MIKSAISYEVAKRTLKARLSGVHDVVARGGSAADQSAAMKKYHRSLKHWNARGFGDGPGRPPWLKSASAWANTLPHPDVERWKRLAAAGTVAGAALGTAAGAAIATALAARKKKRQLAA